MPGIAIPRSLQPPGYNPPCKVKRTTVEVIKNEHYEITKAQGFIDSYTKNIAKLDEDEWKQRGWMTNAINDNKDSIRFHQKILIEAYEKYILERKDYINLHLDDKIYVETEQNRIKMCQKRIENFKLILAQPP